MHLRKRDACDKKMSVRGKQNFDGDKNNSKIAGTVANTFLSIFPFKTTYRTKRIRNINFFPEIVNSNL